MLYEIEGFDEMEGFDELEGYEEFGEFEGFDPEESIKSLPKLVGPKKDVLKAAKIVAKAGGGTKAVKKVAKPPLTKEEEFGDFEDEAEGDWEVELEAAGADMELLGEVSALAEMVAEAESLEEAEQFWGMLAQAAVPLIGNLVSSLMKESEDEWAMEYEYSFDEWEDDGFADDEGDEFWGAALSGLAKIAGPLIRKAIPVVGRGIRALGRFAISKGRSFLKRTARAVPATLARTGVSLAKQAMAGRPMTASNIAGTLGNQVWRTMSNRRNYARAMSLNRRLGRYGLGSYPHRRRYPRRRRSYRRPTYGRTYTPRYRTYGYGYR